MTDPKNRLGEARKQIRLAAEEINDRALLENLREARELVETVEGDLPDRSGEP